MDDAELDKVRGAWNPHTSQYDTIQYMRWVELTIHAKNPDQSSSP